MAADNQSTGIKFRYGASYKKEINMVSPRGRGGGQSSKDTFPLYTTWKRGEGVPDSMSK